MIHFTDHGGRKLRHVYVRLIFWGAVWEGNPGPSPSAKEIHQAVHRIMQSDYMRPLFQYGVDTGINAPPVIVSTTTPPNAFTNPDVEEFVLSLLAANVIPGPDQQEDSLYMVIMPPGTVDQDMNGFVSGQHSYTTYHAQNASLQMSAKDNLFYGWVLGYPTLDDVTRLFSHELVEACTDPVSDTGVVGDPGSCSSAFSLCEIADVCEGTSGPINGVNVQGYWSEIDGQCILPEMVILPSWSTVIPWIEIHQNDPSWLVTLWQAIHGGDPSLEFHELVTLSVIVALANTLGPSNISAELRKLVLPALELQIRRAEDADPRPVLQQPLNETMLHDFAQHINRMAGVLLASGRLLPERNSP